LRIGVGLRVIVLLIRSLFQQLCVLQTHDQLELLLLHALDFTFVHLLLVSFSLQSFFNLGACTVLLFNQIHLALVESFILLLADHLLHPLSLLLLVSSLDLKFLLLLHLVLLGLVSSANGLMVAGLLVLLDTVELVHLDLSVVTSLLLLLNLLLHRALLFGLLVLNVSLSLTNDQSRSLSSLLDFLDCLTTKTTSVIKRTFYHFRFHACKPTDVSS